MATAAKKKKPRDHTFAKAALILSAVAVAFTLIIGLGGGLLLLANEQRNRDDAREANFKLCERANYTRAELHVAYSQPPLIDRDKLAPYADREPLLVGILTGQPKTTAKNLKRVQLLNPIVFCEPNREGKPAVALSGRRQQDFVELYRELKLKPLPTIAPER